MTEERPEFWVVTDIETPGLSRDAEILEVAMIAIDSQTLEEMGRLQTLVRHPYVKNISLEVLEMHTKSGLWQDLKDAPIFPWTHAQLAERIAAFWRATFKQASFSRSVRLVGNTVFFDQGCLQTSCPELVPMLSHRIYDCSTLRDSYKKWYGEDLVPPAAGKHRAMADCEYSLALLRAHKKLMDHVVELRKALAVPMEVGSWSKAGIPGGEPLIGGSDD